MKKYLKIAFCLILCIVLFLGSFVISVTKCFTRPFFYLDEENVSEIQVQHKGTKGYYILDENDEKFILAYISELRLTRAYGVSIKEAVLSGGNIWRMFTIKTDNKDIEIYNFPNDYMIIGDKVYKKLSKTKNMEDDFYSLTYVWQSSSKYKELTYREEPKFLLDAMKGGKQNEN